MQSAEPIKSIDLDRDERESIWTFPRRWRTRFFVLFYALTIGSTAWGTRELINGVGFVGLAYRDFIVIYVQSIAGSVVTSMLLIDLMRSLKMLSNAIEDWLIEKRKKREAEWRAREEEWRAHDEKLRAEAFEYGQLVANCKAEGKEPPPPPWESNQN